MAQIARFRSRYSIREDKTSGSEIEGIEMVSARHLCN